MKALSIRQPWAHLIVHGGKDIENRTWITKLRGRFLVHASKGMTRQEHEFVCSFCAQRGLTMPPAFEHLERGGIVGSVEIVDCVTTSQSPWYMGNVGFVLANPAPLPFLRCNGQLGFFDVAEEVLAHAEQGGAA